MSQKCTIVMYHYVRELPYTRYPEIKGLKTSLFKEQLLWLQKHYNFVTHLDLIDAAYNGRNFQTMRHGLPLMTPIVTTIPMFFLFWMKLGYKEPFFRQ